MWKAMMFSVWPVRTSLAALRIKIHRYQSTEKQCVYLRDGELDKFNLDGIMKAKLRSTNQAHCCIHNFTYHIFYLKSLTEYGIIFFPQNVAHI